MTWPEAIARVRELGPGWRLPTEDEFREVLYPNQDAIAAGLSNGRLYLDYWCSTSSGWGESYHLYFSFYTVQAYRVYIDAKMINAIAVRDADAIEILFRSF